MNPKRTSFSLRWVFLLAVFLYSGTAVAADWRIVRMSGDVRVFYNNVTWIALKSDYRLKPGDAVWTGHNGRIMILSEGARVILKPRSMIKIPAQRLPENFNVLFQSRGEVDASVQKRTTEHFSIYTPYLAAVVKGTKFSVEVDDEITVLRVREGIVEATDKRSGQTIDVVAGQYVAIMHDVAGSMIGNAEGAAPPGNSTGSGDFNGTSNNRDGASSGRGSTGGGTGNNDDPIRCGGGNCGKGIGKGGGNGTGNERNRNRN